MSQQTSENEGLADDTLRSQLKEISDSTAFDKLGVSDNEELPPSPCRSRSSNQQNEAWERMKQREEALKLREKELVAKLQNIEEQDFSLQEERRQHQESILFLARKTSELEAREARADERERRLSVLSGTTASSVGTPPSSSKKLRRQSPILSTPPRKETPSFSESAAQTEQDHTISEEVVVEEVVDTPKVEKLVGTAKLEHLVGIEKLEQSVGTQIEEELVETPNTPEAISGRTAVEESLPLQNGNHDHGAKVSERKTANGRAPRVAKQYRCCRCARACTSRMFRFGAYLLIVMKILALVGIVVVPQFPRETVEGMSLWLPAPLQTLMNDIYSKTPLELHVPSVSDAKLTNSGAQQCQEALLKLRSDLVGLQEQRLVLHQVWEETVAAPILENISDSIPTGPPIEQEKSVALASSGDQQTSPQEKIAPEGNSWFGWRYPAFVGVAGMIACAFF